MVDYRKSALVHMLSLKSGNLAFVLQVYGVWSKDLTLIPNPIIHSLAQRFPDHIATPFMIEDGRRHEKPSSVQIIERKNMEALF